MLSLVERSRTHDLKGMSNDANGHELLAVVSSVHHQRVAEPFDDGALSLAETFDGKTAC